MLVNNNPTVRIGGHDGGTSAPAATLAAAASSSSWPSLVWTIDGWDIHLIPLSIKSSDEAGQGGHYQQDHQPPDHQGPEQLCPVVQTIRLSDMEICLQLTQFSGQLLLRQMKSSTNEMPLQQAAPSSGISKTMTASTTKVGTGSRSDTSINDDTETGGIGGERVLEPVDYDINYSGHSDCIADNAGRNQAAVSTITMDNALTSSVEALPNEVPKCNELKHDSNVNGSDASSSNQGKESNYSSPRDVDLGSKGDHEVQTYSELPTSTTSLIVSKASIMNKNGREDIEKIAVNDETLYTVHSRSLEREYGFRQTSQTGAAVLAAHYLRSKRVIEPPVPSSLIDPSTNQVHLTSSNWIDSPQRRGMGHTIGWKSAVLSVLASNKIRMPVQAREERTAMRKRWERTRSIQHGSSIKPITSDIPIDNHDDNNAPTPSVSTTRLHQLCSARHVTLIELEQALQDDPSAIRFQDSQGCLPLHLLSDNDELISEPDGLQVASAFAVRLMQSYPDAIVTKNHLGLMPFIQILVDWYRYTYEEQDLSKTQRDSDIALEGGRIRSFFSPARRVNEDGNMVTIHLGQDQLARAARFVGRMVHIDLATTGPQALESWHDLTPTKQSLWSKSTGTCPHVVMWEEAEWCLSMLSIAMDELGSSSVGQLGSGHNSHGRALYPSSKKLDGLKARNDLVAHLVSEIPTILKTLLLVEDEGGQARRRLLRLSIIRRILLSPHSVGPWMISMLRKQGIPAKRAVDYLELVSNTTAVDYVGGFRTILENDLEEYGSEKAKLMEAIKKQNGTVACLVMLETRDTERAAATTAVRHVMSQSLSRTFVVGLVLIDFVLHVTLMVAFRTDVESKRIRVVGTSILGEVPTKVVLIICVHYIVRKCCEVLSLLPLSTTLVWSYLRSLWNVLDTFTISLTIAAISYNQQMPGDYRNGFNALVVGLLWLKVIGFLNVINKQMSTFIMAVGQILIDLRYFALVLFAVILCFGDMFIVAVSTADNGNFCFENATSLSGPAQDFCSPHSINAYLRVYALLLGDISLDDYKQMNALEALFTLFTVIGIVILLNVLIAVTSDSYERARIRGEKLFGLARVTFVAQNEALESFLDPGENPLEKFTSIREPGKALVLLVPLLRWVTLLTLIGTALYALIFLLNRLWELVSSTDYASIALIAILLLVLTIAVWIVLMFAFRHLLSRYKWFPHVETAGHAVAQHVAKYVFGLKESNHHTTRFGSDGGTDDDEWSGRLGYMERLLKHTVEKINDNVSQQLLALEKRMLECKTDETSYYKSKDP